MEKEVKKNSEEKQELFCTKCGAKIDENEKFCSSCGKAITDENKTIFCSKCGKEVEEKKKFCPYCGNKLGPSINLNIKPIAEKIKKTTDNKDMIKNVKIGIIAIIALIVVIFLGGKIVSKIFISPEKLLNQGKYEEAYKKAKKSDKENILKENLITYLCADSENSLKDPSSFQIKDAWYEEGKIVLDISGKNGFGGVTASYWYYTFDKDENKYKLYTTVSDFDKETVYSFDDFDERIEKALKNAAKTVIKGIVNDSSKKIDKDAIKRINQLHTDGNLQNVKLLDEVNSLYPSDSSSV